MSTAPNRRVLLRPPADLRHGVKIELVVTAWVDDNEFGLDTIEFINPVPVDSVWPEGAPHVVTALAVKDALSARAFVRVEAPNPAWQPGMAPLPGMAAPAPYVVTTVAL